MPAFQSLAATKRKHEEEENEASRKRVFTGSRTLDDSDEVWMVQWRNPQTKKHKTWNGDGVLVARRVGESTLYDVDGTVMVSTKISTSFPLRAGSCLFFGSKEIELDRSISQGEFLSGACFGHSLTSVTSTSYAPLPTNKFKQPSFKASIGKENSESHRPDALVDGGGSGPQEITNYSLHWTANWRKPQDRKNKTWDGDAYVSLLDRKLIMLTEDGKMMGSTPWQGQALYAGFSTMIAGREVELDVAVSSSQLPSMTVPEKVSETPSTSGTVVNTIPTARFYAPSKPKVKGPRHDPNSPGALVMKEPTKEHIKEFNKKNLPVNPVVIDPILSSKMRPHQKEGVAFLYECVMGMRKYEGQGCILADEMGLGKTLQTIALVWTLLRQNPYAGPFSAVQKVLIVCPVSLINNWKAEFYKWLGRDRVGILTCDKKTSGIDTFGNSKVHEVLIIGYERLRSVINKVAHIHPPIGLIICDEGHRLKSTNSKTAAVFKAFHTRRRVILSGTPIQNDLGEFHAMADFCNPGLLDDYAVFRKVYEVPILKSRMPDATRKEIELGNGRTEQLLSIAKSFVLRRDASLLKNLLPPKTEYVVFVTPTKLQLAMFTHILQPAHLEDLIQSSTAESLALISILTKISNSPILLKATVDNAKGKTTPSAQRKAVHDALEYLPEKTHIADVTLSGKLIVLSKMLETLYKRTEEKCVLVSHYTSTLNILEAYCKKMSYAYYRLDGQTPQNRRQEYVNAFNKGTQRNSFIFLLSSKAGGVGINLIGASRLFMIDSDWNPSHDLQSMARCYRDGQKRPVFIYRLLTAGTIDEKIYQRQVTKLGLSESLIGSSTSNSKSDSFTRKDLRDIFRVHPNTICNTHDLIQCGCDQETGDNDDDDDDNDDDGGFYQEGLSDVPTSGFVAASEVTNDDLSSVEEAFLQKKKEGLAALGEWKHLNCLKFSVRDSIRDDILRQVCTAGDDSSSKDIDLDNMQEMGTPTTDRLPEGTITFLFEKSSTTITEIE